MAASGHDCPASVSSFKFPPFPLSLSLSLFFLFFFFIFTSILLPSCCIILFPPFYLIFLPNTAIMPRQFFIGGNFKMYDFPLPLRPENKSRSRQDQDEIIRISLS